MSKKEKTAQPAIMRKRLMYISLITAVILNVPMLLLIRSINDVLMIALNTLIQAVIWWIVLQIGYVIYAGVGKLLRRS